MNTCDELYMRRALQLASMGGGDAAPNPRVGAVIVADGRIVGEGWHRRCGQPHAEVNAVRSVADPSVLCRSTIYVTLEPCAHYGRTPPCAALLIEAGIPRVVIGVQDPFAKVNGLGIKMLREAGAEVTVGVLEAECRALNEKFMTAHSLKRPYVTLKWAQTADGFAGATDSDGHPSPIQISNPLSAAGVHRLRSMHDAIMVGSGTVLADNPRLDTRLWCGPSPRIVIADRRRRIPADANVMRRDDTIILTEKSDDIAAMLHSLYADHGITSLLVEGGPTLLQSFIDAGIYDAIRRETSPVCIGRGIAAPRLDRVPSERTVTSIRGNIIEAFNVKNL